MSVRRLALVIVAATGLLVVAFVGAAPGKPFKVTSTLDGKTVLPHHLRWLGYSKLPAAQIKKVDFLIDGKVRWTETGAPYVYSDDDGRGGHKGYLVTSWLTSGRHRFSVRAVTTDGRTATDTVVARVLPATPVPAALAGTWKRTLAEPVPPDPGALSQNPGPAGTYTITFDRRWIEDRYPGRYKPITSDTQPCDGCILRNDYVPGPTTFHVWGSATTGPITPANPVGGWWCNPDGPRATYSWSVSGDTLALAPAGGVDACHARGTVWTGEWKRVG
jgi:hypothetical protein